jgi:hypothetical protein
MKGDEEENKQRREEEMKKKGRKEIETPQKGRESKFITVKDCTEARSEAKPPKWTWKKPKADQGPGLRTSGPQDHSDGE